MKENKALEDDILELIDGGYNYSVVKDGFEGFAGRMAGLLREHNIDLDKGLASIRPIINRSNPELTEEEYDRLSSLIKDRYNRPFRK